MRFPLRRSIRSLALVGLPLWLALSAACTPPASEQASSPKGSVTILMGEYPASLSLLGKMDRNSEILAAQLTDSLLDYDHEMRLVPRVAESYEISDDLKRIAFKLRDGVRWHDGRPVTAEDVVFTVEQVRDAAVENRTFGSEFDALESVIALDNRTVEARYSQMTPDVLEGWRVPLIPRHLAQPGAALLTGEFARHPVGCGPFRFLDARPDESIRLAANPDYWDGAPALERLEFRIYPDLRTGYHALLAGDVDLIVASHDMWVQAQGNPELEGFMYTKLAVFHTGWNMRRPFFAEAGVRRAMLLALDRQKFIDSVVRGGALRGVTSFPPGMPWSDRSLLPLDYDPERARQLLDEAGWVDRDGDGVRERDGRSFEFKLMITASSMALNDQVAVWQTQSWSEIGIKAEIEKFDWPTFRQRRQDGEFDAALASISFSASPDQYSLYHSSQGDAFNFWGLSDPELDRLLTAARATWEVGERYRLYQAIQRRLHELQPIASLFHFSTPVLHRRGLKGVRGTPLGFLGTVDGPRRWHWDSDSVGD